MSQRLYDTHVAFTARQTFALRKLAKERGESFAAVVRDAVAIYLGLTQPQEPAPSAADALPPQDVAIVPPKRPAARAHPWRGAQALPRERSLRGKAG